jgi:hypothetical protein
MPQHPPCAVRVIQFGENRQAFGEHLPRLLEVTFQGDGNMLVVLVTTL